MEPVPRFPDGPRPTPARKAAPGREGMRGIAALAIPRAIPRTRADSLLEIIDRLSSPPA